MAVVFLQKKTVFDKWNGQNFVPVISIDSLFFVAILKKILHNEKKDFQAETLNIIIKINHKHFCIIF